MIVQRDHDRTAGGVRRSRIGELGMLVELSGDVEDGLIPLLRHELTSALDRGCSRFVVDLTRVTALDLRAVRTVHAAAARAAKREGAVAVVCRDRPLRRVFADHTDGLVAIRRTLAEALEAVNSSGGRHL